MVGAFVLALGLILLPLPCADDLLVEAGAVADTCVAGPSSVPQDSSSPASGPDTCPCACHLGIANGPALAQVPEPLSLALLTPLRAKGLEAVAPPITHPPVG